MPKSNEAAKQKGRVVYIEPTDFAEYKLREETRTTEPLDNISWNLEDLQYTVDLQVISPDRYNVNSQVQKGYEGISTTISGEKSLEWISFMEGKDFGNDVNFLTDAYTEITFQEISNRGESQKEALGIDAIDISFDSHFFPLVTIKFTDVRATALFGPTDNEYVQTKRFEEGEKNNDYGKMFDAKSKMSSSFFKSLFHFPYPRFMLSVMGFYGERVTFQLAVNDFKTNFNSTNGNFDVTVSFIGYMYGLYTDLPMSMVFTAPYYNKKYWEDHLSTTFKFNEGQPIITFIEFLEAYYRLNKEDDSNSTDSNAKEVKIYKKLNDAKSLLEDIQRLFSVFDEQFTNNILPKYTGGEDSPKVFLLFSKNENYGITSKKYEELRNAVNSYNSNYVEIETERLNIENFSIYNTNELSFTRVISNEVSSGEGKEDEKNIAKKINSIKDEIRDIKDKDGQYIKKYYHFYNRGDFEDSIVKKINTITSEINNRTESVDKIMMDIIEKKLGFKPTIENIYRMIFAHIETFIDALDSTVLKTIESKRTTGERTAGYLGLNSTNSDMPKRCDNSTFIPPFPLCKDKEGNVVYPGNYFDGGNNNIQNIDEVKFIEKIVSGIEDFNNAAAEGLNKINSLSDEGEGIHFSPVSVSDVLYNGKNPYLLLKEKLTEQQTDKFKASLIEYFILARLVMYSDANYTGGINSIKEDVYNLELENFKKTDISISNNVKAILTNDITDYPSYKNLVYPYIGDNKFKYNCCYFFTDPFNKDANGNRFSDNEDTDNALVILNGKYDEGIKNIEAINEDFIDKDYISGDKAKRKSWSKVGSADEYTLSYINKKIKTKGEIGFLGNLKDGTDKSWAFDEMYVKYTAMGENILGDYEAGILQISNPVISEVDKRAEVVDDIYLSRPKVNSGDTEIQSVMSKQTNKYFRAFLLLGSLSTYFTPDGWTEYAHHFDPKKSSYALISKFPKVLLLYYGACVYFQRKKGFSDEGIDLNHPALRYINDYIRDMGEKYGQDYYVLFTNQKNNIFLGKDPGDGYKLGVQKGFSKVVFDAYQNYFEEWVGSEFPYIDGILSNNSDSSILQNEIVTSEISSNINTEGGYHDGRKTLFKFRKNTNGSQDKAIKTLLCEDVYVYKRPETYFCDKRTIIFGNEFRERIKKMFSDYKTVDEINDEQRKTEEREGNNKLEQKKALYYSLKRLYDKWLSCYKLQGVQEFPFVLNTPEVDREYRKIRYTTNADNSKINSEFDSFIFVDSFYRDISSKFLVNPELYMNVIKSYTAKEIMDSNASVFEFMAEVAEKNSLLFVSLPVYNNLYNVDNIVNIFTPNKKYDAGNSNRYKIPGNTYMIMYTGEASSKLDLGENSEYDDDGITEIQDIFDSGEDKVPVLPSELKGIFTNEANSNNEISYTIPVFGVTFGKQNQMYFKNVSVNMDNPKVTDYSIANLIQISYGGAHGDSEGYNTGIGQDIYTIYANRSYTCTVEMMGCINIMPMMYFQLNNIPMFRGLYIIISVSHSIIPGNVTTKFTGVRVSKNHIGEVKAVFDYQSLLNKMNTADSVIKVSGDGVTTCPTYEDEKLEKGYFKLSDFLNSNTAKKLGICNIPMDSDKINFAAFKRRATEFCINLLDPLYENYKSISGGDTFYINSGLRSETLNKAIGGSSTSAHMSAYAADLIPRSGNIEKFKAFVYYYLIKNSGYDQFLDEKSKPSSSGWVHLGYKNSSGGQRKQMMWTTDGKKFTTISKLESDPWVQSHYFKYINSVIPNPYWK